MLHPLMIVIVRTAFSANVSLMYIADTTWYLSGMSMCNIS